MATLASALLTRDVSAEQASEQAELQAYYDSVAGNPWLAGGLPMLGKVVGGALGGPLGAFLGGELAKYGYKARTGAYDEVPEFERGRFNRGAVDETRKRIVDQQQAAILNDLVGTAASAGTAFVSAGGMDALKKEGLGTAFTWGEGGKAGFLGAPQSAGGGGMGWGGWQDMPVAKDQFQTAYGGFTPAEGMPAEGIDVSGLGATAGQVHQSPGGMPGLGQGNIPVTSTAQINYPTMTAPTGDPRPSYWDYLWGTPGQGYQRAPNI